MSDAEVFAALCALPEKFHVGVERRIATYTMNWETDESIPDPPAWFIVLSLGEDGASFAARAPTLAAAWAEVRGQIAAFAEVL